MSRVRVLVWHRVAEADLPAVRAAYHRISAELAGTPGLLGNELLRADGDQVVVLSEWESLAAFRDWESGATHRGTTAELRPFQDRDRDRPFDVLTVLAARSGATVAERRTAWT